MNKQILAVSLLTLAGSTAALAAPQETLDYVALNGAAPLIGTAALGGGNSIVSGTATGAYTVRSATLAGNVSEWGAGTYGSETRVQVTMPGGANVVFGPFSPLTSTPPGPVAFSITLNVNPTVAAGEWTVQPYETFNDASVDATYDALALTLDDEALPVGQPDAFTDLGDFTLANRSVDQTITLTTGNEVVWFKMKLPAVNAVGAGYVDLFATCTDPDAGVNGTTDLDDTDLALYSATTAQLITWDDLTGPGFFGQLSYGSTIARPATVITGQTAGAAFTGQSGVLSEGFYYLAVGQYNVAHPANVTDNWGAVTSNTFDTYTDTVLHIRTQLNSAPYPPSGTGASSPATVVVGSNVLLTVLVVPGGNPVSSGIAVSADLSGLGGSATQQFYDNGTNGDVTAGDGTFSYSYTIPATATESALTLPFTITDAQSRTGTGTIPVGLDAAGDLPTTAGIPVGTGSLDSISGTFTDNDVDMYKISICDTANFTAATAPATSDTQLFLFNLDGTGVTSDDDNPAGGTDSIITGVFVPAAGDYYIAVTRYNTDPVDAGANLIWANTPFGVERAPDGPGSASPVAAWTGLTGGTAPYTITFTGTCYPTNGPVCGPADVGGQGGAPGADGHLDNNDFIVYIDTFFAHLPSADIGVTGGVPGTDGAWDNNDFIVFIDQFFQAPASCR